MKKKHNVLLVLFVFSIILSIISSSTMVKMAIDIHHMNKDLDNLNTEFDRYCKNITDMNVKLQYIEDSIDEYNKRIEIKNKESIPDIGFATADTEYLKNTVFANKAIDKCYYDFKDGSTRSTDFVDGKYISIGIYSNLLEEWVDRKYPIDTFFICLSYKFKGNDEYIESEVIHYDVFKELINTGSYDGYNINIDHMNLIHKRPSQCTTDELMDETLIAIELVVYMDE